MKPISERMPQALNRISRRDLLLVGLPLLLVLVGGFWAAAQFIRPAPPDRVVMTTGSANGAYVAFAARYREILARYHIELVEKPSAGAGENLQRLRDANFEVDAGFVQGGIGQANDDDTLVSLGSLFHEPLWVFYRKGLTRHGVELDRIGQLKGKRLAVGAPGSGTRYLAVELLGANGIDAGSAQMLDTGGLDAVAALQRGEVDAAFIVGPSQSAAVWLLLYSPGVLLLSEAQADAYTRRFPYLTRVTLPQGAIDLVRNIPAHDVTLVSPVATLLAREDTHPAILQLLLEAASETHGGPGIFQKPGDFPNAQGVDFPLAKEADRYYKSGKPLLQRYLPFWAATLIDRMVVMLVPLIALVLPIVKFGPAAYSWRVRSRIYRRYGELKFLEAEVEAQPEKHSRAEWLERVDAVEAAVNRIPTPLAFSDMLYTLRGHLGLVRETILRRTKGV